MVCLMMKNFGIVRLATNSFEEIQEWTRFLLSPPTTNRRTTTVNGFLWIGTSLPLSSLFAACMVGSARSLRAAFMQRLKIPSFCLPLLLLFSPPAGKVKENSWERFYCVSDGYKFEYYKIKNVVRPIFHLTCRFPFLSSAPHCAAATGGGRMCAFINCRRAEHRN